MMRLRTVVVWSGLAVVLLIPVAITATIGWRPIFGPAARPLTNRTFESTPARLERGRYLFTSVSVCVGCHTPRDESRDGFPSKEGLEASGHVWSDEGSPWLTAPNLTPDKETGAGNWTDDQIARAIREGIGHDGRALFPIMPYQLFSAMSDEDLASVVVYLRTLKPIRNALPKTVVPFPPGPLINSVPQPVTAAVPAPDLSTPAKRGEYLVRIGVCSDCHTPMDERGNKLPGMDFAGGFVLTQGATTAASGNLTPDPSGIPYYTEDLFVSTMRTGRVVARELNDIMPWAFYRNMTDDDLKAIFAYLRTLKPVKHTVDNSVAPTLCPVCGAKHGKGDQNRKP